VKANTILHGKNTVIPVVTNIRTGVVLDQACLKQDSSGVSVNFLLPQWEKRECDNCTKGKRTNQSVQKMFGSEDDVTIAELKWTLALADNIIQGSHTSWKITNSFSGNVLEFYEIRNCPGKNIASTWNKKACE